MRKPFKEEMRDLKRDLLNLKFIFLPLIISVELSAQIPINGFCKYSHQKISAGFSSSFNLNFNDDAYADFILFNPASQKVLSLEGQVGGKTVVNGEFNLPTSISNLQPVFNNKREVLGYFFTSRLNREVGILNFNKIGKPEIATKIKLNSYPEHINSFTNLAGRTELLVCGSSFNGLSIFKFENNELSQNNVIQGSTYSTAVLIDISNDGYADIAAFNLLKNRIEIFYNNGFNHYRFVRSLNVKSEVKSLSKFDFSFDGYQDLIYSTENSIEIIYGDFASKYDKQVSIHTTLNVDEFIYGDFNKDGYFDFAYLNINSGTVSFIFGKSENLFYQEIPYLQRKGIKSILPFYSKFINGITAVNENGEFYSITNLNGFSEDVSILPAIKPSKINYFDKENDGIIDFSFIEEYTNTLNLIVRDPEGIPTSFYSYPLSGEHNNILVADNYAQEKSFYFFSINKRLIEILDINFENNKFERSEIYSPGVIKDIKIKESKSDVKKSAVVLAFTKEQTLELGFYEYRDFRYLFTSYPSFSVNALTANISFTNSEDLYYWLEEDDKYKLYQYKISKDNSSPKKLIEISADNIKPVGTFSGDLLNKFSASSISLFNNAKKNFAVVTSGDNANVLENNFDLKDFRITDRNQLFFGEMRFNGLNYLFVYLPEKKSLKRISFIKDGTQILTTDIAFADHLTSYFIKNLDSKRYHLVYTDQVDGCIKIKRL